MSTFCNSARQPGELCASLHFRVRGAEVDGAEAAEAVEAAERLWLADKLTSRLSIVLAGTVEGLLRSAACSHRSHAKRVVVLPQALATENTLRGVRASISGGVCSDETSIVTSQPLIWQEKFRRSEIRLECFLTAPIRSSFVPPHAFVKGGTGRNQRLLNFHPPAGTLSAGRLERFVCFQVPHPGTT